MVNRQPEALRLADWLDHMRANGTFDYNSIPKAAAELRRLHAENLLLHERHAGDNQILQSIETQRDGLLEALSGLVGCIDHGSQNPTQKLEVARAAIAKATGETK